MSVWVITARENPGESSATLCAFEDEKKAREIAAAHTHYIATVPDPSGAMHITEDNLDEYYATRARWWANSPLGPYMKDELALNYNEYVVWEMRVFTTEPQLNVFSVQPEEFAKHLRRAHLHDQARKVTSFGFKKDTPTVDQVLDATAWIRDMFFGILKDRERKLK